jgi:hypothetical protein
MSAHAAVVRQDVRGHFSGDPALQFALAVRWLGNAAIRPDERSRIQGQVCAVLPPLYPTVARAVFGSTTLLAGSSEYDIGQRFEAQVAPTAAGDDEAMPLDVTS